MQQTQQMAEDHVLDTRGLLCPLPVIKAAEAIGRLSRGQVLKILASDPGSWADIPSWAEALGHQLLAKDKPEKGLFAFWVKRS